MDKSNIQLTSKRWKRLIPVAFITYSLAYLDRANYSFGVAGGMGESLHITASIASLLSALFFLGYFFFQVPAAWFAEKKSAKKLVFWSLILWGVLAASNGMITNVKVLMVTRFMLGIIESAVMPAMLIFLSNWFTKKERSRANTFLILGNPATVLWMSIVSGYLVNSVGWRWMFIIEGIPPVIWAFFWLKLADNKPKEAKWLTDQEKKDIEMAMEEEQKGIKPVKNYREAFKSPTVIILSFQYFFWSIGVYGFVMWLPSILKASPQIGIVSAGWLSSLPYALAIILMLVSSYYSDRTGNRKTFVWVYLLIGTVAFFGSYLIGTSNFWLSYILLVIAGGVMYAPYGPFFAIITEILPKNVSGGASALINSMGALGSFVGSYVVGYLNGITGSVNASYIFMSGSLLLSVFLMAAVKSSKASKNIVEVEAI
ncbi:MFS transporter [Clostridium chromiireducens]|uniref:Putative tartrate transporter n=1 Tax=Clostridium chromiireducens TaxID=225345 RepID=A0A1V4IW45_9CLOT|nr:MFS transporter [Clostridium chromiireducens]OPJ64262.1 putative tartrate transporter [Clostridium chromiireducens]